MRCARKRAFKRAPRGVEVDDLVQEACVRAWHDWPRFDSTKSSAQTYVWNSLKYGIEDAVRNTGRVSRAIAVGKGGSDLVRRQANAVAWPSSLTPPDWFLSVNEGLSIEWCQAPVRHRGFDEVDNREEVLKILGMLRGKQRRAMKLYFLSDLSYKAVAEIMGHHESRVCQLVKTAISEIRFRLRLA